MINLLFFGALLLTLFAGILFFLAAQVKGYYFIKLIGGTALIILSVFSFFVVRNNLGYAYAAPIPENADMIAAFLDPLDRSQAYVWLLQQGELKPRAFVVKLKKDEMRSLEEALKAMAEGKRVKTGSKNKGPPRQSGEAETQLPRESQNAYVNRERRGDDEIVFYQFDQPAARPKGQ